MLISFLKLNSTTIQLQLMKLELLVLKLVRCRDFHICKHSFVGFGREKARGLNNDGVGVKYVELNRSYSLCDSHYHRKNAENLEGKNFFRMFSCIL